MKSEATLTPNPLWLGSLKNKIPVLQFANDVL